MGYPGEIDTEFVGAILHRRRAVISRWAPFAYEKVFVMESEKTPAAEPATSPSAASADGARRTSRRQEIRAALLAVPAVLTLSSSASAQTTGSTRGYVT